MGLRLVTPATADIVTLAEAKSHLHVLFDDDDVYIQSLCDAARDWLTGETAWLGCSVVSQVWELTRESFPSGKIVIPRPPLITVDGVFYTPADGGAEVEIADFRTIGATTAYNGYILPAKNSAWPETDNEPGSVRIAFTAGFASVPPAIRHAAMLLVGHWYENREASSESKMEGLPMAVDALLYPYRNWGAQ